MLNGREKKAKSITIMSCGQKYQKNVSTINGMNTLEIIDLLKLAIKVFFLVFMMMKHRLRKSIFTTSS